MTHVRFGNSSSQKVEVVETFGLRTVGAVPVQWGHAEIDRYERVQERVISRMSQVAGR